MGPKQKGGVEHINYALVAKTHPPRYYMHKYWARKPHNVVSEYIKHYSKKGDIVLDPFAGSGVTAIEAIKLGRKAIAIDLDPMASFITRMTAIPIDIEKMKIEFKAIENELKNKINGLYRTRCIKCKDANAIISHVVWKTTDKSEEIVEEWYNCACSKDIIKKKPDKADLENIKIFENIKIDSWCPRNELLWNTRINVAKDTKICDLFTKRNLATLVMLYERIDKIYDRRFRDIFKFIFTGFMAKSSKLNFVNVGGYKSKGRGWAIRGYWIPPEHMEQNVWNDFEGQYKLVLRGKEDSNLIINRFEEAKSFDDIEQNSNILIKTFNALELEKILPPNSVDYVFTDPPYWDAVPYLELDYMWSSWLEFIPNFEDEIIVSNSQERRKTPEIYERMLKAAFQQIFRVLKSGKWMTVTFHNTNIRAWNAIISSCILAGFDLEKIIYQAPAKPSAKGLLAPYASAIGDYYIRFRKPEVDMKNNIEHVDEERYRRIVAEAAKKIIAERAEPTAYTFILNGIIVELKQEGALLSGKQNPDDVMKSLLNKEFVLVDAIDEKGKVVGKKWWLKDPSSVPYLEIIPLADRVETAIVDVLRRKVKISFDDVLQEIFIKFPNAMTPETQDIRAILQEYAAPTKDGNWMLKDKVKIRESEHSEMIYYLAIIGEKAGLDVWIGQKEQGEVYNSKRLSSLMTNKNPVWRFIPVMNLDRVKQIDVIWHDEGRVKFEFEIENTTAITEAIVRGSNIPHDNIKRLIVIPEEREGLLYRKMKEPMLNESIIKNNWKFLFYKDIKNFFEKHKRSERIDAGELEKLFKLPKEAREKQNSLKIYM